ncbi:hypothetical protein RB195_010454 [Necator americanus]|uniref:Tas retrotransposon peptidase A16 n=1 Tax=Necator americanus TaxID=51031 RepID=A0ABR1CZU0_NECAM
MYVARTTKRYRVQSIARPRKGLTIYGITSCASFVHPQNTTLRSATASTPRQEKPVSVAGGKERAKGNHKPSSTSTRTHQLSNQHQEQNTAHIEQQDDAVAKLHSSEDISGIRETYLPIGELTIMDPSTRKLRKTAELLDLGAECSFIDQKLAEELCLPTLKTTTLRIRTFGARRIQECMSRKVPLEILDEKGEPCNTAGYSSPERRHAPRWGEVVTGDQGGSVFHGKLIEHPTRASSMGEVLAMGEEATEEFMQPERRPGLDRRGNIEKILAHDAEERRRLLCPSFLERNSHCVTG